MEIDGTDMEDSSSSIPLFVVQRCWFSGPQQQSQPMDYRRLFVRQREAEEAAYHSAHAWCGPGSNSNNNNNVKTLLLPSYPASNPSGSSYGFIANGSLFWVRQLHAQVLSSPISTTTTSTLTANPDVSLGWAHAVMTEGVIGGTGNRNSRRGTEVSEGRVFLGHSDLCQSRGWRLCRELRDNSQLCLVPVGGNLDYQSQVFLQGWPAQMVVTPAASIAMQQQQQQDNHKRQFSWQANENDENKNYIEVENPFGPPTSSKRRRMNHHCHHAENNTNTVKHVSMVPEYGVWDDAMSSYGVFGERA